MLASAAASSAATSQIPVRQLTIPPDSLLVTPTSFGPLLLCQPLDAARTLFPTARDTVASGESDDQWPSLVVTSTAGHTTLFESSWIDHNHVWRVSTTDPRYASRRGYRVGTPIAALRARGDVLRLTDPEGILVLHDITEAQYFLIDEAAAARYLALDTTFSLDPRLLDSTATIRMLFVSGYCRR